MEIALFWSQSATLWLDLLVRSIATVLYEYRLVTAARESTPAVSTAPNIITAGERFTLNGHLNIGECS